ncbi:hypothetical protein BK708_26270 [Bacillus thuringiensis serovar yunnanensis]|nr:hypothetical protein BK708_26270 [Bacillus thuringiensis serovar yunnanensis]
MECGTDSRRTEGKGALTHRSDVVRLLRNKKKKTFAEIGKLLKQQKTNRLSAKPKQKRNHLRYFLFRFGKNGIRVATKER